MKFYAKHRANRVWSYSVLCEQCYANDEKKKATIHDFHNLDSPGFHEVPVEYPRNVYCRYCGERQLAPVVEEKEIVKKPRWKWSGSVGQSFLVDDFPIYRQYDVDEYVRQRVQRLNDNIVYEAGNEAFASWLNYRLDENG